jgi:MbtH protein
MANPFDDEAANYFVLINDEGQYSLWPTAIDVPAGWRVTFGEAPRQECMDYVDTHWVDMRPASLVAAMERGSD